MEGGDAFQTDRRHVALYAIVGALRACADRLSLMTVHTETFIPCVIFRNRRMGIVTRRAPHCSLGFLKAKTLH